MAQWQTRRVEGRPGADAVFKALADPTRRLLLDRLNAKNGLTLNELCSGLDMARQSASKHVAILEDADLIVVVRRGREKLHYLNAAPISEIARRWINQYDAQRVHTLDALKQVLEDKPVTPSPFVYKTYINTTPETLWQALTDPAFTREYWQIEFETDWQPGSEMTWLHHGLTITDPEQVVVEADPPRRLSYTWHSYPPEWAKQSGIAEERRVRLVTEPRSQVTFEIEPLDGQCRLTVVHEFFAEDTLASTMVSEGWPRVLSNLKSYLETGNARRL